MFVLGQLWYEIGVVRATPVGARPTAAPPCCSPPYFLSCRTCLENIGRSYRHGGKLALDMVYNGLPPSWQDLPIFTQQNQLRPCSCHPCS